MSARFGAILLSGRLEAIGVRPEGRSSAYLCGRSARSLRLYVAALVALSGATLVPVPLRFPADQDRFERVACAAGICAQEQLTSARWTLNDPTQ